MLNRLSKNKYVQRTFWILLLAIIWEGIAFSEGFSPLKFPSIETILHSLYLSVISGGIINQTLYSLLLISKGLIIGLIIALIFSLLSIMSKTFESLVETLISIFHPLPGIALLPLIIFWIGIGSNAIVFIIVHSVVWPMVINLLTGFRSIPTIYKQVGQNYGLNGFNIVLNIMIPASLPYFIAGIKIGWARAWRALISAEMIFGAAGSIGGLGWFIYKNRVFMDTPGIFAGLIIIVLIGMIVEDFIFNKLEKHTVKKWGMSI